MACNKPVQKQVKKTDNAPENVNPIINRNQKEGKMSSLVLKEMPEFKLEAFNAETGKFVTVSSEQYKGKWAIICFYPADFTFVCPTEIAAMNARLDEFRKMGVDVLAVSTDTQFSHKRFVETEPLLKGLRMTIAADPTGQVTRSFGVMIEAEGVALRGRFIVNPDGIIVTEETMAPSVGRNVHELIRQVQAWQHAYKTGEVCPANWKPGKKTLPVNTEIEDLTGRVGDYVTIEEILS
ncbi:MAG: peroxiredoxin [Acidobacteria bacterium]|nr:MAG: peroxiredoxin [Acidobacteriota bacterium]